MGDLLLLASPLAVLNLTETTVVDLWGRTDGRERCAIFTRDVVTNGKGHAG